MGKQCVTLLDNPPWPETLDGNVNQLCRPEKAEILQKLAVQPDFSQHQNQFGDGHAAEKITKILTEFQK